MIHYIAESHWHRYWTCPHHIVWYKWKWWEDSHSKWLLHYCMHSVSYSRRPLESFEEWFILPWDRWNTNWEMPQASRNQHWWCLCQCRRAWAERSGGKRTYTCTLDLLDVVYGSSLGSSCTWCSEGHCFWHGWRPLAKALLPVWEIPEEM